HLVRGRVPENDAGETSRDRLRDCRGGTEPRNGIQRQPLPDRDADRCRDDRDRGAALRVTRESAQPIQSGDDHRIWNGSERYHDPAGVQRSRRTRADPVRGMAPGWTPPCALGWAKRSGSCARFWGLSLRAERGRKTPQSEDEPAEVGLARGPTARERLLQDD